MFKVPEKYRVTFGRLGSDKSIGNNGLFFVKNLRSGQTLRVIASVGEGWEHASVSLPERCPTWEEMCSIKDLFWGDEDIVIQYHPKKSEYVNCHPYCLHLWRAEGTNEYCKVPPKILVG